MTRFGVMKHLRVLEEAGLVVTRRSGREKLHFLNPVPIRLIHDRWIDKYTERQVSALAELKTELEETHEHDHDHARTTTQVYQVFIKATPEQIWDAITKPEFTAALLPRRPDHVDARPARVARPRRRVWGDEAVFEFDPPRRLVHGWRSLYDPSSPPRSESRVTWEIEPRRRRRLHADRHPRPAGGRAEDRRVRQRRGLDGRAERAEDAARDRRSR